MPKGFFFFTTFYYGHMQGFKKKQKYVVQGSRGDFLNYRSFSERQTNFLFYVFDFKVTSWLPKMLHGNTSYLLSEISCSRFGVNGPVSQSCTVAKREEFWRATGQSNLVYKWLTTTHLALFLIYCLADAIEKMGIHG